MSPTRTPRGRPSTFLGETVLVHLSSLHPNTWNVNKLNAFQYSKLLESISTYGFFDPILARKCVLHGDLEIIGGEHRWDACRDLGMDPVPVVVMEVDDVTARKISLIDNELHGQADPGALSALLKDLIATSPDDILKGLPYTDDILKSLTGFAPLPPLPAAPDNSPGAPSPSGSGAVPEKWVERTYRMPAGAAEVLDEAFSRIRDLNAPDPLTDSQCLEFLAAEYLAS